MAPVADTVHFIVNVTARARDDHWVAHTQETGITTYGKTEDEAIRFAGEANVRLIQRLKALGAEVLERYLTDHLIEFRIGSSGPGTADVRAKTGRYANAARKLAA